MYLHWRACRTSRCAWPPGRQILHRDVGAGKVIFAPNGEHRWKDEDQLERAVDVGWISAADAQRVRSEGERVIERAARREYPFDGELISWRPDPAWPIPELPADWAAIAGE